MKIDCNIKDFLQILEDFSNKGVEMVGLEIDSELGGLKIIPISNSELHPVTVGKTVMS